MSGNDRNSAIKLKKINENVNVNAGRAALHLNSCWESCIHLKVSWTFRHDFAVLSFYISENLLEMLKLLTNVA